MSLWSHVLNNFMWLAMKLGDKLGLMKMDGSRLSAGPTGVYANCWDSWVACTFCGGGGPEDIVISLTGVGHYFMTYGYVPVLDDNGRLARLYLSTGNPIPVLTYNTKANDGLVRQEIHYDITRMVYDDTPEEILQELTLSKVSREKLDYVLNLRPVDTVKL